MKFQYSFRHMESSKALMYEFERKMSQGLEPLIQTSSPIQATFIVENGEHKIHVELHARNHALIEVTEVSEDMRKTLELLFDTLTKTLTKEKAKQTQHHVKVDRFQAAMAASTVGAGLEVPEDEDDFFDAEADEGSLPSPS